ncbi:hypothetical protein Tco_0519397 [Tanacetum coccineum]
MFWTLALYKYLENDDGMIHYIFQKQFCTDNDSFDLPLMYFVNGLSLHFRRREFFLATGFKLGSLSFREYRNGDILFLNRLFQEKIGSVALAAKPKDSEEFHPVLHGSKKGRDAALIDRVRDLEGEQRQHDDISRMAEDAEPKVESEIRRLYKQREARLNKIVEEENRIKCIRHMNSSAQMKFALERCVPKKRKYVDVMRSPLVGLPTSLNVPIMEQLANQNNVFNALMIEKFKALNPWIEVVNNKISLTKDDSEVGEDINESTNATQIKSSIALPKLKMSFEFSLS